MTIEWVPCSSQPLCPADAASQQCQHSVSHTRSLVPQSLQAASAAAQRTGAELQCRLAPHPVVPWNKVNLMLSACTSKARSCRPRPEIVQGGCMHVALVANTHHQHSALSFLLLWCPAHTGICQLLASYIRAFHSGQPLSVRRAGPTDSSGNSGHHV